MKRRWKGRFTKEGKQKRLKTLSDKCIESTRLPNNILNKKEYISPTESKSGWGEGRRIVELKHIADQMKACKNCEKPLFLHNIYREQRVGYASILYVTCECGILNSVTTGKSHRSPDKARKGMPIYDINTKAVLGVIHSGLTYRQMNSLMAAMEVKGLHHTAMMRRRQEIDPHVQNVAKESCLTALQEEATTCKMVIDSQDQSHQEQQEGIFKYDMGWQKRGSGRAYDSKSGVGTLIGNNTGKICAFGVRVSDCRMCSNNEKNDKGNITPHNCAKNWSGSAKAMEPDVGVNLIKTVEQEGVKVKTIIMDDDTTTMARIRQEIQHSISKWSDINHTAKHLTNSLFSLQKKHKCLSNNVIAYLKKCFNYALAQTKAKPDQCKSQIDQIIPHSFGEHDNCGEWCGYKKNPEEYKHKVLVNNLSGDNLRKDLEAIFSVFSANADRIAPGGSTKDVESFNNMVASKAPKRCHFSASSNLLTRVGCAVAQKNLGNKYISDIYEKVGLSPGRVCRAEAERRDSERKRQKLYVNKRENKLKKLQKKLRNRMKQCSKEKQEGVTYKTAVDTTSGNELEIPLPKVKPVLENLTVADNLVFFDLETGSLSKDCDILQIAATQENKFFSEYVRPKKTISPSASKVTGLTAQGGVLFIHGTPHVSLPLKEVLESFLDWLSTMNKVVLVGHNLRRFDYPRLLGAIKKAGLVERFQSVCLGGIDTLSLFREMFPGENSYTQSALYNKMFQDEYNAHNALSDVRSLEKMFKFSCPSPKSILQHSFSTEWSMQLYTYQYDADTNCQTLQVLIDKKVVSKQTANKIAGSGLNYNHLRTVYKEIGSEGLRKLLSEKTAGVTRVTTCKKNLDRINAYFVALDQNISESPSNMCDNPKTNTL